MHLVSSCANLSVDVVAGLAMPALPYVSTLIIDLDAHFLYLFSIKRHFVGHKIISILV